MDTNVSFMDAILLLLTVLQVIAIFWVAISSYKVKRDLLRTVQLNSTMCNNIEKLTDELKKTDSICVDIIHHIERTDAIVNSIAGDVSGVDAMGNVEPFEGPDDE